MKLQIVQPQNERGNYQGERKHLSELKRELLQVKHIKVEIMKNLIRSIGRQS